MCEVVRRAGMDERGKAGQEKQVMETAQYSRSTTSSERKLIADIATYSFRSTACLEQPTAYLHIKAATIQSYGARTRIRGGSCTNDS